MSWLYLVVGIACLIVLQSLRGVLSLIFPTSQPRPVPKPASSKAGAFDLYDQGTAELAALGFEGPVWLENVTEPPDCGGVAIHGVYRNPQENVVVWRSPPVDLAQPNILLTYFSTSLRDGRYAVTQVSDPYFEAIGDPRTPAQTIAPTDLETALEQHRTFVGGFECGVTPYGASNRGILHFAGEHVNGIRQRLLKDGKIREVGGVARPTLRFAATLLQKLWRRPKAKIGDPQPIPAERLAHLAGVVAGVQSRAPARLAQWWLLLLSAALFLGVGGPILGLQVTAIILAVILFHEAGHWVAMRAFGYRDPHVTLLPLLGGVTQGYETDPSAAKRAWVSLAGPVPGVILGWVILGNAGWTTAGLWSDWLLMTASFLLIVNYLNILPVPPLDGSHVLRALLPARWVVLQVAVVLAGVLLGIYVAYLMEFWVLAFIAATQLFAVRNLWIEAQAIRRLDRERPPESADHRTRIEWVLKKLEERSGAPRIAAKRVGQAQQVLHQLDTKPMGWLQGALVSLVFLSFLAVPLGVLVLAPAAFMLDDGDWEAEALEFEQRSDRLYAQAEQMAVTELAAALSGGAELASGATEEQLQAAGERLGRPLPAQLKEFYTVVDGLSAEGIGPLREIAPLEDGSVEAETLSYMEYQGELLFFDSDDMQVPIAPALTGRWWIVGRGEYDETTLYFDPDFGPGAPSVYVVGVDGGMAYADMFDMLRETWVSRELSAQFEAEYEQDYQRELARMEAMPIEDLLEAFPEPSLIERLLTAGLNLPDPATAEAIHELESRLERPLPDDHRRLLLQHNGFPSMALLAARDIGPATSMAEEQFQYLIGWSLDVGDGGPLQRHELDACWIVAGHVVDLTGEGETGSLIPQILWCPDQPPARRYLSPSYDGSFPDLTAVVRAAAARWSVID